MQFVFPKPQPKTPTPRKESNPNPQNPFAALQNHFTTLITTVSTSLSDHQNPSSLKTHLESTLGDLGNQARHAIQAAASRLAPPRSDGSPAWARVSHFGGGGGARSEAEPAHRFDLAMQTEAMEERLAGVPVYALSNSAEEFVLVSGARTGRSLGLFCFKKEDAEALLDQMKSMDQEMRQGSKVVAVALNKVFQLKVNGVAFRFVPDPSQVANAIKEKEKAGDSIDGFFGVPVFQSKSLVLRSQKKRYRPVFFRKEDLEESLRRASLQQRQLNPSLRKGDIQVGVLEEIIEAMKGSSVSKWDDVVFIPPGFDVSTSVSEERATANA